MGAGYTRQAQNNIVDGAVIDSDDLNAEFNQVEAAFNSTTGHTHDGTEGEGPKIDTAGLADDAVTPAKVDSTGTFEVAGLVVGGTTLNSSNLEVLDGATLSTAELNILAGATVTTAELNTLEGITATTGDLNILDGATITTTELNYLDGVTSNVQTQLDDLAGVGAGGVTQVTATSPIASSGGANPDISLTGTVPIANGGTGQTGTPSGGQLLIGNGTGGFARNTITGGTNITVTNGNGTITIDADVDAGGVQSVTASSPLSATTGDNPNISLGTVPVSKGGTGTTVLTSGRYLKGNGTSAIATQIGVPATDITGTLPVSNGGTGRSSLTNGYYLLGNGTGDIAMEPTIPSSKVTGLPTFGTMASQNSNNVQITDGSITGLDDFSVTGGEAVFNPSNFSDRTLVVGDSSSPEGEWNAFIQGRPTANPALYVAAGLNSNAINTAMRLDYSSSYYLWFSFGTYNNNIGGIVANTTQSVQYLTTSDYRLKNDVAPMQNALDRIDSLNPIRFNWVNDPEAPTVDGFLAHEVAEVVPEAIHGEKDAVHEDGSIKPQGIDQAKLVPLLVGAVQELTARVEQLEAQLNSQ